MVLTQNEKNKKWRKENREHSNYIATRSTARSFIRNKSKIEDLDELEQLINSRRIELEKK